MAAPTTDAPAVLAEGLVKRFGATVALAGVSLGIEEGTVFGLLGPNGAGKTTLVRVFTTLLRTTRAGLARFVAVPEAGETIHHPLEVLGDRWGELWPRPRRSYAGARLLLSAGVRSDQPV